MDAALGVIEFSSIPSGYRIYNRILKDVYLRVFKELIIAPGRFIVMIEGSYAGVNHALEYAVNTGAGGIYDYALVGNIHPRLASYLTGESRSPGPVSDLGLIETITVCGGLELMNRLLHGTDVDLVSVNYDVEMHGSCLLAIKGSISSIRTALELAGSGELISNPEETVFQSITGELLNR